MDRILSHFLILILSICAIACSDEQPSPNVLLNQEGSIYYHDELESLIIVVSIPGSYDSQDIYIPNTDLNGFQEGQSVIFSGNISSYNSQALKVFVGQQFYHISLSEIKLIN